MNLLPLPVRPKTRGECQGSERPCPWSTCRHHLGLGALITGADETCSLDVADRGQHSLEEVAGHMGISKQAVQQTEAMAVRKLKRKHVLRQMKDEDE